MEKEAKAREEKEKAEMEATMEGDMMEAMEGEMMAAEWSYELMETVSHVVMLSSLTLIQHFPKETFR